MVCIQGMIECEDHLFAVRVSYVGVVCEVKAGQLVVAIRPGVINISLPYK
jgi:hypothetical protein